jgi:hypothetical protein
MNNQQHINFLTEKVAYFQKALAGKNPHDFEYGLYDYHEGALEAYEIALNSAMGLYEKKECPECAEMSDDFRGDWCKECDKHYSGDE